jgi:hypothetical protein
MKRLLALPACLGLLFLAAVPAGADSGTGPPPNPTCHPAFGPGIPSTGPCTETDHFSQLAFPISPTPGCGPQIFAFLTANGNGVQHITVNSAGDSWFTTTFTGDAVISTLVVSGSPPNLTFSAGTPLFSGHIASWFGGEFNRSNYVLHDTTTFQGTDLSNGQSLHLHFVDHASSVPPNDLPSGPPNVFPPSNASTFFMKVVC